MDGWVGDGKNVETVGRWADSLVSGWGTGGKVGRWVNGDMGGYVYRWTYMWLSNR